MEIDLEQGVGDPEALSARLKSQVCIVGGGIAGLILAHRLMLGGVKVTLLEAGGRSPEAEVGPHPFAAELRGVPHRGTDEGRVCALGGCSWTWGGQLLPFPEDASWPIPAVEIARHGAHWGVPFNTALFFAANRMKLPGLLAALPGLVPRLSRFTPFSRRNLVHVLGRKLLASPQVNVVLHAGVSELLPGERGDCIRSATVLTPRGDTLQIEAEVFVVAAGTVETCRLLLASRSVATGGIGNAYGQVGRNFHDHLTVSAAVCRWAARSRMLRELGPWVVRPRRQRQTVYSMKLEPSAALRAELGVHRGMAHLTVEEPEGSAMGEVRRLLRARQGGDADVSVGGWTAKLPQLAWSALRVAWEARVRHRRYVSAEATVRLQINVAQDAPSESRVRLRDAHDERGIRKAVVDWRVSDAELRSLRRLAEYLRGGLKAAGVGDGAEWEPSLFAEGEASDVELRGRLDDARHAMGGACMGTDPLTSMVNTDLRVHGVKNLYVASAAVFPDGSPQLPTLTLSGLCVRLAERLVAEFGEAGTSEHG